MLNSCTSHGFQVSAIQRLGLRTAMLTGDCAGAAAAVAAAVALQPANVHASLLPDDKLAKVALGDGARYEPPSLCAQAAMASAHALSTCDSP